MKYIHVRTMSQLVRTCSVCGLWNGQMSTPFYEKMALAVPKEQRLPNKDTVTPSSCVSCSDFDMFDASMKQFLA